MHELFSSSSFNPSPHSLLKRLYLSKWFERRDSTNIFACGAVCLVGLPFHQVCQFSSVTVGLRYGMVWGLVVVKTRLTDD